MPDKEKIADEVIAGDWGINPTRRRRLTEAGHDYPAIQAIVNERIGIMPTAAVVSTQKVAEQVLSGAWGDNIPERQKRLTAAGYDYGVVEAIVSASLADAQPNQKPSDEQVAEQVIIGAWGEGLERRNRLVGAGYSYNAVQSIVNDKLGNTTLGKLPDDIVANQVIYGSWGNGIEREHRLAAANYDHATIQVLVNRKLGL